MDFEEKEFVIETLKAATLYKDLLNDFERIVITDIICRYAKFGEKVSIKGKQWDILEQVADKLNIKHCGRKLVKGVLDG